MPTTIAITVAAAVAIPHSWALPLKVNMPTTLAIVVAIVVAAVVAIVGAQNKQTSDNLPMHGVYPYNMLWHKQRRYDLTHRSAE